MSLPSVELRVGALRLALRPDLGGCIAGLWHGRTPVLRSTEPAELTGARLSGSYPLLPYSNRVGFRRFEWLGQAHTTAANFDDNPHSVHGMGWLRAWTVLSQTADAHQAEAVLHLTHQPDAHWPFAFEAWQTFTLTGDSLRVALRFKNLAPTAQPVGLGWHPYFPKRDSSRLAIAVATRWDSDAVGLPTGTQPQAGGIHGTVAAFNLDNCFDGWQGPALFGDDGLSLQLTSSLDRLVVFTPNNKPYYCVEPVSHVSNAIQMADPLAQGLRSVAPGDSTEAWMALRVVPA
jgi:aldose 1-epimerase